MGTQSAHLMSPSVRSHVGSSFRSNQFHCHLSCAMGDDDLYSEFRHFLEQEGLQEGCTIQHIGQNYKGTRPKKGLTKWLKQIEWLDHFNHEGLDAVRIKVPRASKSGRGNSSGIFDPVTPKCRERRDSPASSGMSFERLNVFLQDGNLHICAGKEIYCKGGVEVGEVLNDVQHKLTQLKTQPCLGFGVVLTLSGLWWSPSDFMFRHQSTQRCISLLKELMRYGEFIGELDLSDNDLDDVFIDDFCAILRECPQITKLVLNMNRLTSVGVLRLASNLYDMAHTNGVREIVLNNNPIEDADGIMKSVHCLCPHVKFDVEPHWTQELGRRASLNKHDWSKYFFGPVQLVRAKMLDSIACGTFARFGLWSTSSVGGRHFRSSCARQLRPQMQWRRRYSMHLSRFWHRFR
jgi:hypothetical protein